MKKNYLNFILILLLICIKTSSKAQQATPVFDTIYASKGYHYSSSQKGKLYDSGGPTNHYHSSENSRILITPNCGLSVTLTFTAFNTENWFDHLRVYNGYNNSAPLLLDVSGNLIPQSVTATSGVMYIEWHSNNTITKSGWKAQWNSVLSVYNPPVAAFEVDTNPPVKVPVSFTDLTLHNPLYWHWNFGDGTQSTLQNPEHAYLQSGTYSVQLIAQNCFSVDTIIQTIVVQPEPKISVQPDTINVTLNCNDSLTVPVTIYNTGPGDLVFHVDESGNGIAKDTSVLIISWFLYHPLNFQLINYINANYHITTSTSANYPPANLDQYDIIIIDGNQPDLFYQNISNNVSKLEAFVAKGGTVLYLLGSKYLLADVNLVGGAVMQRTTKQAKNIGLPFSHPILNGITNPITGIPASYGAFSLVPAGASIITETRKTALPTTIEYAYGKGRVIATTMPWGYKTPTVNAAQLLPNALDYIFSEVSNRPDWIKVPGLKHKVAPGDSLTINVKLNSYGLTVGVYHNQLTFNSNDSVKQIIVPVNLTVVGDAKIVLSDSCIKYGIVAQGTIKKQPLYITNTGCDTLQITGIVSSDTAYTITPTLVAIAPNETQKFVVAFNPQTIGSFNGMLTVSSNVNDTTICLIGASALAPIVQWNTPSLNIALDKCADSISVPVYISNAGGSDLKWNVNGLSNTTVKVLALNYGVDTLNDYPNTIDAISHYFSNYTLNTTSTTDSTVLQGLLANADVLLFPSQSFGNTSYYSSISGVVQNFINKGGVAVVCGSPIWPDNRIYDLGLFTGNPNGLGSNVVCTVTDSNVAIMTGVPLSFNAAIETSFQIITNADKVKVVTYGSEDVVTYRNIGLGKAYYLGFTYNQSNSAINRIISNTIKYAKSYNLPSWITIDSSKGVLAPGDSVLVNATFYSKGLTGGAYASNLIINSNDTLNPVDTIPFILNISYSLCASFSYEPPTSCSGIIAFSDSSLNNPTSWLWDFGDGTFSNLMNPIHSYAAAGTYQVKMQVCNSVTCDSVFQTVVIQGVSGITYTPCLPQTVYPNSTTGIVQVNFNTINKTSDFSVEGYQDFSCYDFTTVMEGQTYPVSITTGTNEKVRVRIDFNNNGLYDVTNEYVYFSNNSATTIHNGNIAIPANTILNTPLRMRIEDESISYPLSIACSDLKYGQCEDYSITILPNSLPPVANFNSTYITGCFDNFQFTDSSTSFPTSWLWFFGDGDTSTLKNPTHQYLTTGTFNVSLQCSNAFGTSTKIIPVVVTNIVAASFSYTGNLLPFLPIQFNGSAPGATYYYWTFDDGGSSILQSPQHVFGNPGVYAVKMQVSIGTCTKIVIDTVTIGAVGINELADESNFEAFPNPFNEELQLAYELVKTQTVSLKITDVIGQTVQLFETDKQQQAGKYSYSFNPKNAGIYFVHFSINGKTKIFKVAKVN